ncbi:hypothetical protein N0V84_011631 [Fusarium piperis]|uniref:Uncharacterized protein n=1 Tax=Fusarium piperis TaxID=1435070 RepID=A0A9W8W429_9HYPO|nr:hypothetical protein N0V84_011631 [Fusarium piperis]
MAFSREQVGLVAEEEATGTVPSRMMRETRDSLVFQFRWEDLLMSSPVALNCIGACVVAATSPSAKEVFDPPRDGFKYLDDSGGKYGLQDNLLRCTDLGRFAFLEAQSSMGKIKTLAEIFYNKFGDVMQSLDSPEDARVLLRRQFEALGRSSIECFEAAKKIDDKFEQWLYHACELHLACVAKQPSSQDQLSVNEIELAISKASIDYQRQTGNEVKEATGNLERSLEAATEAYQKASDGFPTGWDIVGQQIVRQLTDSLTTALNQAVPGLVSNLSPVAKAPALTDVVKGIIGKAPNNNPGTNSVAGPNAPSATRPKDAADPAYSQVGRDLIYWHLIKAVFIGTDNGIDWDKAKGDATIAFASKMLGNSQKQFASLATSTEPSQKYKAALELVYKVSTGIVAELEKAKDIMYKSPGNDSALVKAWQKEFLDGFAKAIELNATAKSLPGSTVNGSVVLTRDDDPATLVGQIQAKTTQAQVVLESTNNRLNTALASLNATKETYQKSTALLAEQQSKLNELNASLDRLKASDLKLYVQNTVKSILVQCITLALKLKNETTNLVRFFKAISTIIQFVIDKHVNPYIDTVNAIIGSGEDPGERYKIGSYTLTDLQRSSCLNSAITIRSYFSIFADVASMWMDVSQMGVLPGLHMVDQISAHDPRGESSLIRRRANEVQVWSNRAIDEISRESKKRQAKNMQAIETRVAEISQKAKRLPPATPEITKTIAYGAEAAQRAAQQGIQAEADQSLLVKSLATRDAF